MKKLFITSVIVLFGVLFALVTFNGTKAAIVDLPNKIFFTSYRDGNAEIYWMKPDGGSVTRITNNAAYDGQPSCSANATKLAFVSDRAGNKEIYSINSDGTSLNRKTYNSANDFEPALSADGTKIAFVSDRDGNCEIYTMAFNGSGLTRLTFTSTDERYPAWSPDGNKIAFVSNNAIWVMEADGSNLRSLTNMSGAASKPSWSPQGDKVAFAVEESGNSEIYVINVDGSGLTRLTDDPAVDQDPCWSPDSSKIIFTSNRMGNNELFKMSAIDGSGITNLTNNAANDEEPSWGGLVAINTSAPTVTPSFTPTTIPTDTPFPTSIPTPSPTYTIYINVTGMGSVAKNPDLTNYNNGDVVQFTAIPANGWRFDHWEGDLTGAMNPSSLEINGNKIVTAVFSILPSPTPIEPENYIINGKLNLGSFSDIRVIGNGQGACGSLVNWSYFAEFIEYANDVSFSTCNPLNYLYNSSVAGPATKGMRIYHVTTDEWSGRNGYCLETPLLGLEATTYTFSVGYRSEGVSIYDWWNLRLKIEEYYGTGGNPSPTVTIANVNLLGGDSSNTIAGWQLKTFTFNLPSKSEKVFGTNNDAKLRFYLYIEARKRGYNQLPSGHGTTVFVNPQLIKGNQYYLARERSTQEEQELYERTRLYGWGPIPTATPTPTQSPLPTVTPEPGGQDVKVMTIAGLANQKGSTDGIGSEARFYIPVGITADSSGNIYVTDDMIIRKITPSGVVTTVAGAFGQRGSTDGTGPMARFLSPCGITADSSGNLYVADSYNHTIRKITPAGVVTTIAGSAGQTGSADGIGPAARFSIPLGITVDSNGNLYVTDGNNCTIRKITPAGVVTTIAGLAGQPGSTDGIGLAARFTAPAGITVDKNGNLFVSDSGGHIIRRITPAGVVTTIAGAAGQHGSTDGSEEVARFWHPWGITIDNSGNLYVADRANHTIRKITPAGVVTTIAGAAGQGGSTDGIGPAAKFSNPYGITIDSNGNLYVADEGNCIIRKISFQ